MTSRGGGGSFRLDSQAGAGKLGLDDSAGRGWKIHHKTKNSHKKLSGLWPREAGPHCRTSLGGGGKAGWQPPQSVSPGLKQGSDLKVVYQRREVDVRLFQQFLCNQRGNNLQQKRL